MAISTIQEILEEILLTEIVGLQTLVKQIKANTFEVEAKVKNDELDKVYQLWEEILSLSKENRELTYKDVRPFVGKADQMQKAYLSM